MSDAAASEKPFDVFLSHVLNFAFVPPRMEDVSDLRAAPAYTAGVERGAQLGAGGGRFAEHKDEVAVPVHVEARQVALDAVAVEERVAAVGQRDDQAPHGGDEE